MQCSPYSEGCDGGFGYLVFKQFAETGVPAVEAETMEACDASTHHRAVFVANFKEITKVPGQDEILRLLLGARTPDGGEVTDDAVIKVLLTNWRLHVKDGRRFDKAGGKAGNRMRGRREAEEAPAGKMETLARVASFLSEGTRERETSFARLRNLFNSEEFINAFGSSPKSSPSGTGQNIDWLAAMGEDPDHEKGGG